MSDNNEEKAKGTAQGIGGKIKEGVGNLINDPKMANEGRADQVVGNERVEDAKTAERGKGVLEQAGGAIKKGIGNLTGDAQTEAEGEAEKLKGQARQKANE